MSLPDRDIQLTDEDIQTVRKCKQLSFWRGSVPGIVASVLAVNLANRWGFFAENPKIVVPTYFCASLIAYIGGRLCYLPICKHMFLNLNDSRIKDYIIESQGIPRFDRAPDAPLIVSTPIGKDEKYSTPMTYAERRALYRNHPERFTHQPQTSSPREEPASDEYKNSFSALDDDRPPGSYQFDDVYRPRD